MQPYWNPLSEQASLFPPETGVRDGQALVECLDLPESPSGVPWTFSTLAGTEGPRPNAAVASLSSVLEPEHLVSPHYYLSSTACSGILRRAEKRGKALPPMLDIALKAVVSSA